MCALMWDVTNHILNTSATSFEITQCLAPLTDNKRITELNTDPDSSFVSNGIRHCFDITDKGINVKLAETAASRKAKMQYKKAMAKP